MTPTETIAALREQLAEVKRELSSARPNQLTDRWVTIPEPDTPALNSEDRAGLRMRIAAAIEGARMWALVAELNADAHDKRSTESFAMADAVLDRLLACPQEGTT